MKRTRYQRERTEGLIRAYLQLRKALTPAQAELLHAMRAGVASTDEQVTAAWQAENKLGQDLIRFGEYWLDKRVYRGKEVEGRVRVRWQWRRFGERKGVAA